MMKIFLLLSVYMFCLFINSHNCNAEYTCYNDSSALNNAIKTFTGSSKTWHICRNTTWNMGRWDNKKNRYVNGDHPIIMSKNGTRIMCGPNGDVKDNCTFIGGSTGIEIINGKWYDEEDREVLLDLLIQGFTFTGADETDSIYVYPKDLFEVDLTVRNCHFVNNPKLWKNLNVGVDTIKGKETIRVEDCLFENNYVVEDKNSDVGALITGWNSPQISIVRSQFINNGADSSVLVPHIIFAPSERSNIFTGGFISYAQINITNSCFIQNKNFWFTLAHSTNEEDNGLVSGNYQASNSFIHKDKACHGVSYSEKKKDNEILASHICREGGFDASTCPLVSNQPSTQPSEQPSKQPSKQPSILKTSLDSSTAIMRNVMNRKTLVPLLSAISFLIF